MPQTDIQSINKESEQQYPMKNVQSIQEMG